MGRDEPLSDVERLASEVDALWHKLDGIEPLLERIVIALEARRMKPAFPRPEDVCSQDDSTSWDGTFRTILESGWSQKQKAEGKEWTAGGMRFAVAEKIKARLEACGWSVQFSPSDGLDGSSCSAITFRVKPRQDGT